MKKWIIAFGAVTFFVALLLVYCADVKFDNPLDERGSDYLYGDTTDETKKKDTSNGVSGLFDTSQNKDWSCDSKRPELKLIGNQTVTILSNQTGEFTRLMGKGPDGWEAVVELVNHQKGKDTEPFIKIWLTKNGTDTVPSEVMPVPDAYPGQYKIVYTATKPKCGDKPEPESRVERGLTINKFEEADNRPPVITATDGSPMTATVSAYIGEGYVDEGVKAAEANGTPIPALTSITIKDKNGVVQATIPAEATTNAMIVRLNTAMTTYINMANDGAWFTITYTATSSNGQTASKDRRVEAAVRGQASLPTPVIVLNIYSHRINGQTIQHKDTAYALGGTYREKGVKEVYYMKDGNKVTIPVSNVTVPAAPANSQTQISRTLRYDLPAKSGEYQAAFVIRYVRLHLGDCENNESVEPVISWETGGTDQLTLEASSKTWNVTSSWRVASGAGDGGQGGGFPIPYIVDFGGLDPDALVARSAPYTVTFVALSGCGVTSVKTRTVKVQ